MDNINLASYGGIIMKLKTGVLVILLVIGLLGVPNCIFAQDYDYSSNAVLESSIPTVTQTDGLNVQVKGSSGGKSFSSSKSVSKTVKKLDGDDDDASGDDGGSWWIAIIIIIIILVMIAAWYFFLRK
jgi:hypothetical protein